MKRVFSNITRSTVLLATLLSANLALAQRGGGTWRGMGGMTGSTHPALVPRWTNTAVAPQQESFTAQSPADQAAEDRIRRNPENAFCR